MFRSIFRHELPLPQLTWNSEACETGIAVYAHADNLLLTITPETRERGAYRLIVVAPNGAWLTDSACGATPSAAKLTAEVWLRTYRADNPAKDGPNPGA